MKKFIKDGGHALAFCISILVTLFAGIIFGLAIFTVDEGLGVISFIFLLIGLSWVKSNIDHGRY